MIKGGTILKNMQSHLKKTKQASKPKQLFQKSCVLDLHGVSQMKLLESVVLLLWQASLITERFGVLQARIMLGSLATIGKNNPNCCFPLGLKHK